MHAGGCYRCLGSWNQLRNRRRSSQRHREIDRRLAGAPATTNDNSCSSHAAVITLATLLGVALATLVLNLWLLRADPALQQAQAGLQEIQLGFMVMGFIAIAASLMCARLPADAGAEVSGH